MNDIICAISTPLGKGAISIVRMSGQGSLDIASKLFYAKNLDFDSIIPRMLYLGHFDLQDGTKEYCMMVYFKSPKTYTGEDIVEFQVHGGTILTQKMLQILIRNGARIAEPGEFSKRAFENGKMSLDEAENIIGEINAESESELKASLNLSEGRLSSKIKQLQNKLTESIAQIEATLDYPEEDFEKSAKDKLFQDVKDIKKEIDKFISDSQNARFISKGINVAIVGSPNVGKSSLLNALIGQERAIVTDVAGTTRDVLNESISYKGVKLNFIDTAGIRNSEDKVEKIGIEKSKQSIESADVVLWVIDGSRNLEISDLEIKNLLKNYKNTITIINKSDLPRVCSAQPNEIVVSAQNEKNINAIKDRIYNLVINEDIDYNKMIIINERQLGILYECNSVLEELEKSKEESMDVIAMLFKKLWNSLGKITGESENEAIIDLIFSKFCLGK